MELVLDLAPVLAARERIAPHVRRTPVISWSPPGGERVHLKLEQLQVGGSFKARGAFNALLTSPAGSLSRGVVTASGGNHGLGVACAARALGAPATIFLPEKAPASTERRLVGLGSRVIRGGVAWDDAWARAVERARATGALLVHPFDDPAVVAGQGTIGLELVEQVPDLDLVVVAIGGGGLVAGVASVIKALRPGARVVGVEPVGAPSMRESVAAGRVVRLASVKTIAGTLAPLAPSQLTLDLTAASVEEVVLVEDADMLSAMRLLWDELRILVEPAGAAALAALVSGKAPLRGARSPVVLVCGANLDEELAAPVIRGGP
ncbi:MAG TPA: threonine/serine dehydratase [Planctomycetota bacterium]|nr:threonine/serine dehydratase [Planctomycetota bacterium]